MKKKLLQYILVTLLLFIATSISAQTYRVEVNTWLHIRQGPSIETEIVGRVENNDRVYAIETVGEWARIKLTNTTYGYLNTRYLVLVPATERDQSIDYKAEAKLRQQAEQAEQARLESQRRQATADNDDNGSTYDGYDAQYSSRSSLGSMFLGSSDFDFSLFDLFWGSDSSDSESSFSLFGGSDFSLFGLFDLFGSSSPNYNSIDGEYQASPSSEFLSLGSGLLGLLAALLGVVLLINICPAFLAAIFIWIAEFIQNLF